MRAASPRCSRRRRHFPAKTRDQGVLITDAEELALAGAHAWARSTLSLLGGAQLRQRRRRRPAHVAMYAIRTRPDHLVARYSSGSRQVLGERRHAPSDSRDSHRQRGACRRRMGNVDTQPWHHSYASEDPHVARHACGDARHRSCRGCADPRRVWQWSLAVMAMVLLIAAIVLGLVMIPFGFPGHARDLRGDAVLSPARTGRSHWLGDGDWHRRADGHRRRCSSGPSRDALRGSTAGRGVLAGEQSSAV